jgi:8-oxo-dGTP pyrophosphatase MutT (NUDIX family)
MAEPRTSANPDRKAGLRAVMRPRDAATLVIIDRSSPTPRILMGRRRPDQVFLPDTFVFPGGRVDPADRALARKHPLHAHGIASLRIAMRGRPSDTRASALALAAVRETFEEVGFIVGEPCGDTVPRADAWGTFLAEGYRPRLEGLSYFARAITPPGRPRRYDTRFFAVDATEICHRSARVDGELLDIDWFTVAKARTLKLPSITTHILEDVAALVSDEHEAPQVTSPIPFYFHRHGRLERVLLPRPPAADAPALQHDHVA